MPRALALCQRLSFASATTWRLAGAGDERASVPIDRTLSRQRFSFTGLVSSQLACVVDVVLTFLPWPPKPAR